MRQRFIIPFCLPSLNELIDSNRQSRYAGASFKKKMHRYIGLFCGRLCPVQAPCVVLIHYVEPNRMRDVDNVQSATKYILDTLVERGVLAGDGQRHVIAVWPLVTVEKERKEGLVRVTILEDGRREVLGKMVEGFEGMESNS